MPTHLDQIEDGILAIVKASLPQPDVLAAAGSLPGALALPDHWTIDTLKRLLQLAPGVWVTAGRGRMEADVWEAVANLDIGIYVVTKELIALGRRPVPDANLPISAYQIVASLIPALHGSNLADIGTVQVLSFDSLFGDTAVELGASVYLIAATMKIDFDLAPNPSPVPFLRFHTNWDFPPFSTGADYLRWNNEDYSSPPPDAQDDLTLAGAEN